MISTFKPQETKFEPPQDKTSKMACAPSKDSYGPGHQPSLIRVIAVRMKKHWVLSHPLSAQQRHWSDRADAQTDLNLRWVHSHFLGFVMRWLIFSCVLYLVILLFFIYSRKLKFAIHNLFWCKFSRCKYLQECWIQKWSNLWMVAKIKVLMSSSEFTVVIW